MVNFFAKETVPPKYSDRNLYVHNPQVTLMRTTAEEAAIIGRAIASKLNLSKSPDEDILKKILTKLQP